MPDMKLTLPGAKACRVVFQPSGRAGMFTPGTTVLDASRELGVGIESVCGGQGLCGKCVVLVEEGEFPGSDFILSSAHISAPESDEAGFLQRKGYPSIARLACRAQIWGEVLITVPPDSQCQAQVIHKVFSPGRVGLDSPIRLAPLSIPTPPNSRGRSDVEQVLDEFGTQAGHQKSFDYAALRALPQVLREGRGAITATLWKETSIIRVQSGHLVRAWGLAVDIGSTTLAAYLCDLQTGRLLATASATNPQVSYGDDIMSRISYTVNNPDGRERLHASVIAAINSLAQDATFQLGGDTEDIVDVVLVGNSVMHHLVLDLDPAALGRLPFTPVVCDSVDVRAVDLGLFVNPGARVHVLPLIAGFVGADAVGVLLAQAPYLTDEVSLIIDVGTNGEIMLGSRERLLCTSAATGPAFEGAQIAHGMRAAPGAIERVRIHPESWKVRLRVIGQDLWSDTLPEKVIQARGICGSGIIEAVAELLSAGIILPSGRFARSREHPRLIQVEGRPAFVLANATETAFGKPVVITQNDVRAVQLAKAAIYVSARLLMRAMGVGSVSRIVLAGAFGTLVDKERAMRIGMIPDCALERVVSVGNAAGEGACMALLSLAQRREAVRLAQMAQHVLIAQEPDFQDEFAAAMIFPAASE